MAAATIRRRRMATGIVSALAAAAFAVGIALGEGSGTSPSRSPELSPKLLVGERIVVGFRGSSAPSSVRRMIRRGEVAGVILFAYNLPSRTAGRRLIRSLQSIARPAGLRDPLFVMADQEGGLVKRIGGAPTASAREMGSSGAEFSRSQGRRTARNLLDVGINVNLAPVLDVARPGGTIADTDRAFGSSPAGVAATAAPFAQAMQGGGVVATAKHFPGMGAARLNTDFAVQRIELPKRTLRAVDEAPYRRFIAIGGQMVMLSTAIYPAFSGRPAAFTRAIATAELRSRLGFRGISITDALETVAVRDFGGPARAALAAVRAGVDLLLYTEPAAARSARAALLGALRAGRLSGAAVEASAARVLRLRQALVP